MCRNAQAMLRLCGWLASMAASVASAQQPTDEVTRTYIRKAVDRLNVDFVIRGKVVDQDGKLLNRVRLDTHRSMCVAMLREEHYDDTAVVDGTFELRYRQTQGVSLEFRREGYHMQTMGFSSLGPSTHARIEGGTHIDDNVTVVLQKIGKLATLHSYGPVLSWAPDGRLRIWDISAVGAVRTGTKCVEVLGVPPPDVACVYVRVAKSLEPVAPAMQGETTVSPRDGVVQLVVQDRKGGGFVKVAAEGRDNREMSLSMTAAPTDGYQPVLELTAGELVGFRSTQPVYFCFRLNGCLGKGYISNLLYAPASGVQECGPNFCLQPDGSTNVETTTW